MKTWRTLFGGNFDAKRIGCPDVIASVDAYIDRELPVGLAASIGSHITGCERCRALVRERMLLKRRIKTSVTSIRAPFELLSNVKAALWKRNR